ncbi:MAG: OmpH family outer membrane protein [Alphaproteobacteria bacterium]|nr:OmpH family outer membrane protein [Alphaproteobacteria bacterium]
MANYSEQEQTLDLGDMEMQNSLKVSKKEKKENKKVKPAEDNNTEGNNMDADRRKSGPKIQIFVILVLMGIVLYNSYMINSLKHNIEHTYVYNMEAVLMQTGLAEENRKFESDMVGLEKEIDAAEKKVKSMKDKKLQEEYREMYMKSLTLKRNTLVEDHEKFMKSLLKNINKTLTEVAKKNNVKVIFSNKAVIFSTNYVTDVTPVVAKKLKEKMDEN